MQLLRYLEWRLCRISISHDTKSGCCCCRKKCFRFPNGKGSNNDGKREEGGVSRVLTPFLPHGGNSNRFYYFYHSLPFSFFLVPARVLCSTEYALRFLHYDSRPFRRQGGDTPLKLIAAVVENHAVVIVVVSGHQSATRGFFPPPPTPLSSSSRVQFYFLITGNLMSTHSNVLILSSSWPGRGGLNSAFIFKLGTAWWHWPHPVWKCKQWWWNYYCQQNRLNSTCEQCIYVIMCTNNIMMISWRKPVLQKILWQQHHHQSDVINTENILEVFAMRWVMSLSLLRTRRLSQCGQAQKKHR